MRARKKKKEEKQVGEGAEERVRERKREKKTEIVKSKKIVKGKGRPHQVTMRR